ncbi:response regulator transcription factor [Micromonospora sp. CPCC 205556]|uniref:response regulator transcription factor n=1 Tax=Micromonospora sp. CPCC 205556 TaxID=3122398 RepID=UPI002FEF15F1
MIRVLLADDEELIRQALAALLTLEPDIEVVAQAPDGRTALDAARAHRPDVAVVDLEMPPPGGIDLAVELGRALPGCAVVILTGHGRPGHLRRALTAGARGFLAKGAPGGALADVVRRVHSGARYVDPALAAEALSQPECPLTPRELETLRLAEYGTPVAVIARRTHLAAGTVRNHLAACVQKLGAGDRAEAVRIARAAGWL